MILKLFFTFFTVLQFAYCQNTPVLLWGSQSDLKPSLEPISSDKFKDIILPQLENHMTVVFLEPELTTEDLSHCKLESGVSCYKEIMKLSPKSYYINVENPVATLRSAAGHKEYINVDENGEFDVPINYEVGKVVFINFKTTNEVRSQRLYEHASIIAKVYRDWSQIGKIIAVYMGESLNLIRKVRETDPSPKPEPLKSKCYEGEKSLLLCYTDLEFKGSEDDIKVDIKQIKILSDQKPPTSKFDVEIDMAENTTNPQQNNNKLTFTIILEKGYWNISKMRWNNDELKIRPAITVPQNFSYYCGVLSKFSGTDKNALIWSGLQIEAFFTPSEKLVFHDAWHCVGFTSPAIWMGLFVTFMLLTILSYGISWMMDIRTMDRFDDPKGKTITVNVNE